MSQTVCFAVLARINRGKVFLVLSTVAPVIWESTRLVWEQRLTLLATHAPEENSLMPWGNHLKSIALNALKVLSSHQ